MSIALFLCTHDAHYEAYTPSAVKDIVVHAQLRWHGVKLSCGPFFLSLGSHLSQSQSQSSASPNKTKFRSRGDLSQFKYFTLLFNFGLLISWGRPLEFLLPERSRCEDIDLCSDCVGYDKCDPSPLPLSFFQDDRRSSFCLPVVLLCHP